jgi:hypothetical protein
MSKFQSKVQSKFQLNYYKPKKISLEVLASQNSDESYQPFDIDSFQLYNPLYNTFFELNENNYNNVSLNQRFHISDLKTVLDSSNNKYVSKNIFLKFAPLLDPVKYLIGKYENNENLLIVPSLTNYSHEKYLNINNSSYIDNFFYYLSNQLLHTHSFSHGIEYFGSFIGIQKKFKINLADDMDYLLQSEHFNDNRNKRFEIEHTDNPLQNFGSRNNKDKLMIHGSSEISLDELDMDVIETIDIETTCNEIEIVDEDCIYENSSNLSSTCSSNDSELNYSSEEDGDDDGEDSDGGNSDGGNSDEEDSDEEDSDEEDSDGECSDEEEDIPLNGYIYDFPVQMICLEKCVDTLDSLFLKHILDINTAASALFQVVMILMVYQRAYNFTHNDLHTNNVMYIETDEPFLYYKVGNRHFKVPTYGRIFKLIDFGRAIYNFQGTRFCSDSFAPNGDAATQYNCEPFYDKNKPVIEPNNSFDICRLGCSIYDFILEIEEESDPQFEPDLLQSLIIDWVKDDNGKNIIYKKNGDERYPSFKLYKMISRNVHKQTPMDQLNKPLFEPFSIKKGGIIKGSKIMDLDQIPVYI